MAMRLGWAGAAVTAASTAIGAGVYKFYFGGSAIRGGLVGAQIGASLSYAYALGQWPNVGKVAAKGFKAGVFKLVSLAISNWMGGTLDQWTFLRKQQDFVEGFAAGAWAATFGQYLDAFTETEDDEVFRAMASLTLTVTSAVAYSLPEYLSGKKSLEEGLRDIVFTTIPVWFASSAIDGALAPLAPTPLLRDTLKVVLMSIYVKGVNSLIAIFNEHYQA
jgi:hypothetical protein